MVGRRKNRRNNTPPNRHIHRYRRRRRLRRRRRRLLTDRSTDTRWSCSMTLAQLCNQSLTAGCGVELEPHDRPSLHRRRRHVRSFTLSGKTSPNMLFFSLFACLPTACLYMVVCRVVGFATSGLVRLCKATSIIDVSIDCQRSDGGSERDAV